MKRYRFNKKRFATVILSFALMCVIFVLTIVTGLYVERTSPMLNYQLMNDIERGNEMAIEYYESTCIANDRVLFD